MEHRYTVLEKVIFDEALTHSLPSLLEKRGSEKLLILISNTLNNSTSIIRELQAKLTTTSVTVFDSIPAHTPRRDVIAAVDLARKVKADAIVAIGGGSIIDAAKAVQFALNYGINSEEQLTDFAQFADGSRGEKRKTLDDGELKSINEIRCIAVPTTLSGAEFSNTAGVLDTQSGNKEGYRAPNLYPQAIVYDPDLSQHTPEWLWLSTAIRSLDHAVEGFCSPKAYPFLEGQFLHAMILFGQSLRAVKSDPSDMAARALNQQAVWLACCGLGKVSHGASHGIGYILGALCGVPHGYTSCVMLPAVLQWNAEVNADKQHAIAKSLGNEGLAACHQVKQLVADLGLPTNLQSVGVNEEQLSEIAHRASQHPVVRSNPRSINSAEQVMEILRLAWD